MEKHGGKHWTEYQLRQSVSAIDDLVSEASGSGTLQIDAANLILVLQGRVYPGYACNTVTGTISKAALVELQNAVRTRVLELTIELEKSVPGAAEITLGPLVTPPSLNEVEKVTQITHQVVHGNVTTITSSGDRAEFHLTFKQGDIRAFAQALVEAGIEKSDAADLADLVSSEKPESKEQPFGTKARAWLANNIGKAADGTWKVGMDVATKVLTEAAMRYYGFK